jgi:hypothetical protein
MLAEQLVAQGVSQPVSIASLVPTPAGDKRVVETRVVIDPDNVAGTVYR